MKMQGTVIDGGNNDTLPGATIYKEVNGKFVATTSTDVNGFFELPDGYKGPIKVTYIGYEEKILDYAQGYAIILKPKSEAIGEVVVIGKKTPQKASIPFKKELIILAIVCFAYIAYKKFK